MTRDQIQSILRQEYDQQNWLKVLREILPGTDVFATPQTVAASTPGAPQAVQLARVRLGDRKQLAVLEVKVSDRFDLLRNRVGLRNLVVRFIDQAEYHGVLAVFRSQQNDFRFTFAARMAQFDDEGNLVRRETTPRRYTYVLGPNESCRTAAERFLQLSEKGLSATMDDVIEAFSVEKLNKEFFADFSKAFERVKSEIEKRNRWKEKTAKEEAQTLLNRLLFLYFVQRKGWLNRQRGYLFHNFARFANDAPTKTTFLDAFLRPLFTKLSTEGSQADISGHDLPFLNGGLFNDEYGDEQHDEVVRRHHELYISNEVFRSVFDDLLERYNFTIQEDSPTNYEVAIDPEMLGQIFEELILTSEDSETAGKSKRHDTGSHYTRRPIVHYLCRDSLAAWLESQPPFVGKKDAPQRVRRLLALDATEGIDEETRNALKEILTPEEAAVLRERLFELRACDPAVGSGAFRSANKQYLSLVPFHPLDLNNPVERAQHDTVARLVDTIVWLKAQVGMADKAQEHSSDPLMPSFFEQWVNALVYELFFPQEIHAAGLHFFDLIQGESLPQLEQLREPDRFSRPQKLFQTTYASDHKLRQALYRLSSLDLVRTIEGKA